MKINQDPNNGYPMLYRGAGRYTGRYPSRIVHTPQGPATVVYMNDPYLCDRLPYDMYPYRGFYPRCHWPYYSTWWW